MRFVIAITGASGVIYGIRTLENLLLQRAEVHLVVSDSGKSVLAHETGSDNILHILEKRKKLSTLSGLSIHDAHDFFTPPASGSFAHNGMAIVPCAMRSIGNLAAGIGDNLIHRAADVCLKEKRPLILVPREAPLHAIHLKNLLSLASAGATILPASPAFYHFPKDMEALVDSVVARILDHLGCPQNLMPPWQGT
ncbi:4-hydroxy-3-polyprenylbenzoate decarboxylase [Desulfobotulus alkaliphilus]|uniref:Flavin prenyltransferase UbiX n=1 Tax=Desulfobotulus alkaliphilus TaxID=622671 RepID=A0A562RTM0_9BACT|nr:flavin prenyltransferase UbiX [Desulfobotulus alkaliphilus]TWI72467.1 4-hydroxy-3-polyprenylbenzoate decarboxylase [Desulfobotulus alkaliphilus]